MKRVRRVPAGPAWPALLALGLACGQMPPPSGDHVRDLQTRAVYAGRSPVAYWGPDPQRYVSWHQHSNRLVPVYTFGTRDGGPGVDLRDYTGEHSAYRSAEALRRLYGDVPPGTWNPVADYLDQTDLAALERAAAAAGRRHIFLFLFDGLGWHGTRAAATVASGRVGYEKGRGSGLHFQDYTAGGTTQFGLVVTSPRDDRHRGDVDAQSVRDTGSGLSGGYDAGQGGASPWAPGSDAGYVIAENFGSPVRHAVVDSAAAATALCTGVKTYNGAINVDPRGRRLRPIAHELQDRGFAIGIVTSVPVSHATPAAAYAHNVMRRDFQDITRDLVGLPSVSHPVEPLPGVDVLIGCGYGVERRRDRVQGENFVPGNRYITAAELRAIDVHRGGRYVLALRTPGVDGADGLLAAADEASRVGARLFGLYGLAQDRPHLPYRTADGDFRPAPDRRRRAERYSDADLLENPTLARMTEAALRVLERDPDGFWLMVEAGDVDWANHDANLDASIGAVQSGDAALRVITDWVERHSDWRESLLIVTSDHAHYLNLPEPGGLVESAGP